MHPHKKYSLYLVLLATELAVFLMILQWRRSVQVPRIVGNAVYNPLYQPLPIESPRNTRRPIIGAKKRKEKRQKQIPQKPIQRKLEERSGFIGRYSTEGLSEDDIKLLQWQCDTGLRKC